MISHQPEYPLPPVSGSAKSELTDSFIQRRGLQPLDTYRKRVKDPQYPSKEVLQSIAETLIARGRLEQ